MQRPPSGQTGARPGVLRLDGGVPIYKTWLEEDVAWIITDDAKAAFKRLSNDEERDGFIDAFWRLRDPTPETEENEFKEEHYHRIAYANEHFGAGIPGRKTDRGRVYILFGEPDEIEKPSVDKPNASQDANASVPAEYPREVWRYRLIEGIGEDVVFEFVDACRCGDYHRTVGPSEQTLAAGVKPEARQTVGLFRPPPLKFPNLALAIEKVHSTPLPFDVLADYVRVTGATTLVPITLQFMDRDLTFAGHGDIDRAAVNLFGRVTSLTGHVVETFEDTVNVDVPPELLPRVLANATSYTHGSLLRPGRYTLKVAAKDANGDRIGTWARALVVPELTDKLAVSSLILAREMRASLPQERRFIPSGVGQIGGMRIYPVAPPADGKPVSFRRDQKINVWMQVYNLQVDEKKHAPSASIEYSIVNTTTKTDLLRLTESTDTKLPLADQVTLQKMMPAAELQPGSYQIQIKVHDKYSGQTISESAAFSVE